MAIDIGLANPLLIYRGDKLVRLERELLLKVEELGRVRRILRRDELVLLGRPLLAAEREARDRQID